MAFVYPTLQALRQDTGSFSVGDIAHVRTPGSTRKVDKYRLESMTSLRSSEESVTWIYQTPPPKPRGGFNWEGYRQTHR